MNHQSMSSSEYAYQVYELLARHQVSEDLRYDGDRTISANGVQACCHCDGTDITFPDPYSDETAKIVVGKTQAPTAVASVVEAILTTFAMHLAFVDADTAALLFEEVD